MKTTRDSFIHNGYTSSEEMEFIQLSERVTNNLSSSVKLIKPQYNDKAKTARSNKVKFFNAIRTNNSDKVLDACIELHKTTNSVCMFETIIQDGILCANENGFFDISGLLMNGTKVFIVDRELNENDMDKILDGKAYFVNINETPESFNTRNYIENATISFRTKNGDIKTITIETNNENEYFFNTITNLYRNEIKEAENDFRPMKPVLYRGFKIDANLCHLLEPYNGDIRGLTPAFKPRNSGILTIKKDMIYAYIHHDFDLLRIYLEFNSELEKFAGTAIYYHKALQYIFTTAAQSGCAELIRNILNDDSAKLYITPEVIANAVADAINYNHVDCIKNLSLENIQSGSFSKLIDAFKTTHMRDDYFVEKRLEILQLIKEKNIMIYGSLYIPLFTYFTNVSKKLNENENKYFKLLFEQLLTNPVLNLELMEKTNNQKQADKRIAYRELHQPQPTVLFIQPNPQYYNQNMFFPPRVIEIPKPVPVPQTNVIENTNNPPGNSEISNEDNNWENYLNF